MILRFYSDFNIVLIPVGQNCVKLNFHDGFSQGCAAAEWPGVWLCRQTPAVLLSSSAIVMPSPSFTEWGHWRTHLIGLLC